MSVNSGLIYIQPIFTSMSVKYLEIEVRSLVPRQTLLRMYEVLVAPYFDYSSKVWGCMGKAKACVTDSRDCKIGLGEL